MSENNLKQPIQIKTPCSLFRYMGEILYNHNGDQNGDDEFTILDYQHTGLLREGGLTFYSHSKDILDDRISGEHKLKDKLSEYEKAKIILEQSITVHSYNPDNPYEVYTDIVDLIQKAYEADSFDDIIDASQYDNSIEAVMAKIEEGIDEQMDSDDFFQLAIGIYNIA